MATRLIRYGEYRQMPWRNGQGTTAEIARAPADGEPAWRLSLATVAQSGPFSAWPDYERSVTLVSGAGFRLVTARGQFVLDEPGASARFDGGETTQCTVLGTKASLDLSLMVRAPGRIVQVACLEWDGTLELPACEARALFVLAGEIHCGSQVLQPHDTLLLEADGLTVSGHGGARFVNLLWRIGGQP